MTGDATQDRVEAAFRRTAEAVGGTFRQDTYLNRPIVQRTDRRWTLTLEWVTGDTGQTTILRAPFHNPERRRFLIRTEGLLDDLWKTLGFLQDVEVGESTFDRRFLVKAPRAHAVRDLLDEEIRTRLLAQRRVDLRIHGPREPFQRPGYPAGIDELQFRETGAITDHERLVALFDLFLALLPRLSPTDPSYASDPEALLARLEGPGGQTRSQWGPVVYWNGDPVRHEAARRLGQLGAAEAVPALIGSLDDPDDQLVATALRALGRIGDERAVTPLFALLGERLRRAEGAPLSEHAAAVLRELGHGATVDDLDRALQGEPEVLRGLAGAARDGIVRALMRVVDSTELQIRPHAARALGVVGATEALALLREKSTAWGMRTRLTEAATGAVAEIERRASLPRPARGAPDGPDTHPRPAGTPDPDPDRHPRPAGAPARRGEVDPEREVDPHQEAGSDREAGPDRAPDPDRAPEPDEGSRGDGKG